MRYGLGVGDSINEDERGLEREEECCAGSGRCAGVDWKRGKVGTAFRFVGLLVVGL